jgi:hypothetical protein
MIYKPLLCIIILTLTTASIAEGIETTEEHNELKEELENFLNLPIIEGIQDTDKITDKQLQEYIATYLVYYRLLVDYYFNETEKDQLSFYSGYPYIAEGTVYNNGVVINYFSNYSSENFSLTGLNHSTLVIKARGQLDKSYSLNRRAVIMSLGDSENINIKNNSGPTSSEDNNLILGSNIDGASIETREVNQIFTYSDIKAFSLRNTRFKIFTIFYPSLNASEFTKDKVIFNLNQSLKEELVIEYLLDLNRTASEIGDIVVVEQVNILLKEMNTDIYSSFNGSLLLEEKLESLDSLSQSRGIRSQLYTKVIRDKYQRDELLREQDEGKSPIEKHQLESQFFFLFIGSILSVCLTDLGEDLNSNGIKAVIHGYATLRQKIKYWMLIISVLASILLGMIIWT